MEFGLEPITKTDAEVLVLGTFPGKESLSAQEYYNDPGNQFWWIVAQILGAPRNPDYNSRVELLKSNKVALWDVLRGCERLGSLDKNIRAGSEQPNDFKGFLQAHPSVRMMLFNGQQAWQYFEKLVIPTLDDHFPAHDILPSTSGTNTHMTREKKTAAWIAIQTL